MGELVFVFYFCTIKRQCHAHPLSVCVALYEWNEDNGLDFHRNTEGIHHLVVRAYHLLFDFEVGGEAVVEFVLCAHTEIRTETVVMLALFADVCSLCGNFFFFPSVVPVCVGETNDGVDGELFSDVEEVVTIDSEVPHSPTCLLGEEVELSFTTDVVGKVVLSFDTEAYGFVVRTIVEVNTDSFGVDLCVGSHADDCGYGEKEHFFHNQKE